jgi:GTP-binding protein
MIHRMFVDRARITVRAGHGGAGSAHMHSEPFKPRGGPDGGDGGRGGNVILRVDTSMFDLSGYKDRPKFQAEAGGPGSRNKRTGAKGADVVIRVPDGIVVTDERGPVADLIGEGTKVIVARGGRGGRGNASLMSARNRAPRTAEPGETGEDHVLNLELRLVADAGLIGLPNAGKSTLLAALTAARPKIADYPFTTIAPNLGVAGEAEDRVVVVDVPGLIEGAHEGKGLGLQFLRHVSRAKALIHVLDMTGDPEADLRTVRQEIRAFDPDLAERPSIVVGTKADLLPLGTPQPAGLDLVVSGVTGQGIEELDARIRELVEKANAELPAPEPFVVLRPGRDPFTVKRDGAGWRVTGQRVERWTSETDIEDERQVEALQRRLIRAGVERRLEQEGARPGDEVTIGGITFEFQPGLPAEATTQTGAQSAPEKETRNDADEA